MHRNKFHYKNLSYNITMFDTDNDIRHQPPNGKVIVIVK